MNLQESIRRIIREEEDRYDDKVGKTFWFEYHCYESPESCDAEIWYRSHQKVKVIGVSEWSYDDKEWRQEDGNPRVYLVQWEDGFQYDVFEDELMESPNEFYRPSPPKRKIQESIRRILREETSDQTQVIKNILELTVMKEYKDLICDIIVVKIDGPRYKDFMNHYDYVLEFIFLIGSKVKKLSDYDIYLQIMNDTGGLLFDYANIRAFVQDAYVKQCD